MDEKLPNRYETPGRPEKPSDRPEKGSENAEKHKHHLQENLAEIRRTAEKEALSAKEIGVGSQEDNTSHRPQQAFVNKELKEMAYARTMNRVRQQLNLPSRLMSRVIHQPAVNAASEFVAKTVGRPSGIAGGGLLALIGTSVYYYIAKHYGYDYNFFVFLALLAGGFILGWIIELLYRMVHPNTKN